MSFDGNIIDADFPKEWEDPLTTGFVNTGKSIYVTRTLNVATLWTRVFTLNDWSSGCYENRDARITRIKCDRDVPGLAYGLINSRNVDDSSILDIYLIVFTNYGSSFVVKKISSETVREIENHNDLGRSLTYIDIFGNVHQNVIKFNVTYSADNRDPNNLYKNNALGCVIKFYIKNSINQNSTGIIRYSIVTSTTIIGSNNPYWHKNMVYLHTLSGNVDEEGPTVTGASLSEKSMYGDWNIYIPASTNGDLIGWVHQQDASILRYVSNVSISVELLNSDGSSSQETTTQIDGSGYIALNGIDCKSGNVVFIGLSDAVLYTTDQGTTWMPHTTDSAVDISAIDGDSFYYFNSQGAFKKSLSGTISEFLPGMRFDNSFNRIAQTNAYVYCLRPMTSISYDLCVHDGVDTTIMKNSLAYPRGINAVTDEALDHVMWMDMGGPQYSTYTSGSVGATLPKMGTWYGNFSSSVKVGLDNISSILDPIWENVYGIPPTATLSDISVTNIDFWPMYEGALCCYISNMSGQNGYGTQRDIHMCVSGIGVYNSTSKAFEGFYQFSTIGSSAPSLHFNIKPAVLSEENVLLKKTIPSLYIDSLSGSKTLLALAFTGLDHTMQSPVWRCFGSKTLTFG